MTVQSDRTKLEHFPVLRLVQLLQRQNIEVNGGSVAMTFMGDKHNDHWYDQEAEGAHGRRFSRPERLIEMHWLQDVPL